MKGGRMIAAGAPETVLDEDVLSDVYDARVRSERRDERTFIWSEL
jgi:ABC-type cobalamin/Fe3+-siderophores transport system ATPase subunit